MEKLKIIVGEGMPDSIPDVFNEVEFYIRDNDDVVLYASVSLPYLINYGEAFLDISNDPRYIFYEEYNSETKSARYICVVKPLGDLKGVYRLGLGIPFKIRDLNISQNVKTRVLK